MGRPARILVAALAASSVVSPLTFEPSPVQPGSPERVSSQTRSDGWLLKKDETDERGQVSALLGTLVNVHSGESVPLDRDGPSPDALSALLEDRAMQERVRFDARLLVVIRTLAAGDSPAGGGPGGPRIEIVSGYRSAKLNEHLRKKGRHVASHSQHSLGHAIDFRLGEATPEEVRKRLQALGWDGGIGQYDSPTDRFIHLDVGKKRRWRGR